MTLTFWCLISSIVLATGSLALGYALVGLWLWAVLIILLGMLWLQEIRQNRDWPASMFLIGFIGLAERGVWIGLGAWWMLLGVVASLSAWDLNHFLYRLQFAQKSKLMKQLEFCHLRRLLIVNGLGLGLAGLALMFHITIGFGTTLFLTALAIVCLSQFIRWSRHENT